MLPPKSSECCPTRSPGWTKRSAIYWAPDLGHSSLAMQVHIGSPGTTSIRPPDKAKRHLCSKVEVETDVYSSGRTSTPLLPTRQMQVAAQMTVTHPTWTVQCIVCTLEKGRTPMDQLRWHCNLSHRGACEKILHEGEPDGISGYVLKTCTDWLVLLRTFQSLNC